MNMSSHLDGLLKALVKIDGAFEEILVINDGSTDDTEAVVGRYESIRLISFRENQGRFKARWAGAREARGEWLLFLDTRLVPAEDFVDALASIIAEEKAAVGWVNIDPNKNVFCLYWLRSHQFLFRRHYQIPAEGIELNLKNYDIYLKGTGVYLCRRQNFLEVCQEIGSENVLSDDTLLLKKMLAKESLWIKPKLRIEWEPRSNYSSFLYRLFDRGPGFVEYHVLDHRGVFFYFVMGGLALLIAWLFLICLNPWLAGYVFLAAMLLIVTSTGLFAKSSLEFIKMAPLHLGVFFAFGFGVIYGLGIHAFRGIRKRINP